eukprot:TRINITY_DN1547_c0_g1_i1.p1 TRINITY_DN1547_c0_g1~~TRINITY_DN1547_c0_g1_i1.p1  ORF type:complete len:270 (-),score=62.63 TRINITY_DN1547_c0_g1_i1:283-1092(-)
MAARQHHHHHGPSPKFLKSCGIKRNRFVLEKPMMGRIFGVYDVNRDHKLDAKELYKLIHDMVSCIGEVIEPSEIQSDTDQFLDGKLHLNFEQFFERYSEQFSNDSDSDSDPEFHDGSGQSDTESEQSDSEAGHSDSEAGQSESSEGEPSDSEADQSDSEAANSDEEAEAVPRRARRQAKDVFLDEDGNAWSDADSDVKSVLDSDDEAEAEKRRARKKERIRKQKQAQKEGEEMRAKQEGEEKEKKKKKREEGTKLGRYDLAPLPNKPLL